MIEGNCFSIVFLKQLSVTKSIGYTPAQRYLTNA